MSILQLGDEMFFVWKFFSARAGRVHIQGQEGIVRWAKIEFILSAVHWLMAAVGCEITIAMTTKWRSCTPLHRPQMPLVRSQAQNLALPHSNSDHRLSSTAFTPF